MTSLRSGVKILPMKKLLGILILGLILTGTSYAANSKDANVIKGLMKFYYTTEKQAKCLVKETKPLVEKEHWNLYAKLFKFKNDDPAAFEEADLSDDDVKSVFGITYVMMVKSGRKCDVTFDVIFEEYDVIFGE